MQDPLVRKQLEPGWIDLTVGEAVVVRNALQATYPSKLFKIADAVTDCDYQRPEGYGPLVKALEDEYGGDGREVVVTSGAKQGLIAVFHAIKKLGVSYVTMRSPYWSQMPEAIRLGGLGMTLGDKPSWGSSYMVVSPNNPDGHVTTYDEALELKKQCDRLGTFLIHDAAYHTPIYMGNQPYVTHLAGTSIYSASKMYGLSGLRVGWVVTDDPRIKKLVCNYVEAASVGVSLLSQKILRNILVHEEWHLDDGRVEFIERARRDLDENRRTICELHPDILDTSDISRFGMFGWFKVGPRFNADQAKVWVPPGQAFGDSKRVRINLGGDPVVLKEAVDRMNALDV